jgi:hypothetical protein
MSNHIRHAIVMNGKVVNIIDYENEQTGTPAGFENGEIAVASVSAQIGWDYVDGVFSDPTPPHIPTPAELNAPIYAQLAAIDQKKIRALSDAIVKNDKKRLEDLELEAEALRAQLVQE